MKRSCLKGKSFFTIMHKPADFALVLSRREDYNLYYNIQSLFIPLSLICYWLSVFHFHHSQSPFRAFSFEILILSGIHFLCKASIPSCFILKVVFKFIQDVFPFKKPCQNISMSASMVLYMIFQVVSSV